MRRHLSAGTISLTAPFRPCFFGVWARLVAAIGLVMVLTAGIAHLDHSGPPVSLWLPLTNLVPPINNLQWQTVFELYRARGQFSVEYPAMSLPHFEVLYPVEWFRLVLLAGQDLLILAGGARLLLDAKKQPAAVWLGYAALFTVAALHTAFIWLVLPVWHVGRADLAQVPFTVRSVLSMLTFAIGIWLAPASSRPSPTTEAMGPPGAGACAIVLAGLIVLQFALGALVAGSRAASVFETWPALNGALWPQGLLMFTPWWKNLLTNALTIQFMHRMCGYAVVACGVASWLAGRSKAERNWAATILAFLLAQSAVGILTLVTGVERELAFTHLIFAMVPIALVARRLRVRRATGATSDFSAPQLEEGLRQSIGMRPIDADLR